MVQLHRRAARHGARGQDQGRGRGGAAHTQEEEETKLKRITRADLPKLYTFM